MWGRKERGWEGGKGRRGETVTMSAEVFEGEEGRKAGNENPPDSQPACLLASLPGQVIANPPPTLITSRQLSLGDVHSLHP